MKKDRKEYTCLEDARKMLNKASLIAKKEFGDNASITVEETEAGKFVICCNTFIYGAVALRGGLKATFKPRITFQVI